MVNVQNINKLIDVLELQRGKGPILMSGFMHSSPKNGADNTCGTVACLAGWANTFRGFGEDGKFDFSLLDTGFGDVEAAAEWFGLEMPEASNLFYMLGDSYVRMSDFDMLPALTRADIALELLRTLRDTGAANWRDAWKSVQPESFNKLAKL